MASKKLDPDHHRYQFDRFIESIVDLDSAGMFRALEGEHSQAQSAMVGRGGPQAVVDGAGKYAQRLRGVMNWFHNGLDFNVHGSSEPLACRLLAQHLIDRGERSPDILSKRPPSE